MQYQEALHLSTQQALYGNDPLYVPAFLEAQTAETAMNFLTDLRERRPKLVEAILEDEDMHWTEAEVGLRAALEADAPGVRWAAAIVAGERAAIGLVPELMRASEDEDLGVQVAAVRALAQIADARAVPVLCRWLGEKRLIPEIRQQIARALGEIGSAEAVEPLIQALRDEDKSVRAAAAEVLGMGLMRFLIGRRIIHRRYGRGVIEKIFRERPPAVVVRLENLSGPESRQVVSLAEDFSLE